MVSGGILQAELVSKKSSLEKRAIVGSSLSRTHINSLLGFTVEVSIGTPSQTFNVLMDTTIHSSYIRNKNSQCTTRTSTSCASIVEFDSTSSSTFVNTTNQVANLVVGDSTLSSAHLVKDRLGFPGMLVPQFEFLVADSLVTAETHDGALGLGLSYNIVNKTLLESLTGLVDQPIFTIYVNENNDGGGLTIGGGNSARFDTNTEDFIWIPVTDKYGNWKATPYWSAVAGTVGVGSALVSVPEESLIVFDTSESLLVTTFELAQSINSQLGATLLENSTDTLAYSLPCNSNIPSIAFTIGNEVLRVSSNEYLIPFNGDVCLSGIIGKSNVGFEDESVRFVLGTSFMRRWYLVFDWGNRQVGVIQAKRETSLEAVFETISIPQLKVTHTESNGGYSKVTISFGLTCFIALFYTYVK